MTLTTDDLVAKFVLKSNPLQGPIILDYLTEGEMGPDLVNICYQKDNITFPHKELSMVNAAKNFWRLVRKWSNPTRSSIYGWIRDLCRHTIALDELFYSGRYSGHVLDDVSTVCQGLKSMNGCIQTVDLGLLEATYATSLKRSKRDAMKVLLSAVIKDQKRMATDRLNLELVDILRRCVGQMWFNSIYKFHREGQGDYSDYETKGGAYQVAFYKDGMGDHDEEPFLQYPSLIIARNLVMTENKVYMDRLDLTIPRTKAAGPLEGDTNFERILAFAFYSNVDEDLTTHCVDKFINERTEEGGVLDWRKFHPMIEEKIHEHVSIEENNYRHLMKYIGEYVWIRPEAEGVPQMESGVISQPPKAKNPEKEQAESGVFTIVAFAAVIGFLFLQA